MNGIRKNDNRSNPELANSTVSTSKNIFLLVMLYLGIHCSACMMPVNQRCPEIVLSPFVHVDTAVLPIHII